MKEKERGVTTINVGLQLRQLRQEKGLSMRALARASGLSANALSMIERGRTSPSVSTLYKLAAAMDLPITAFFHDQPAQEIIVFQDSHTRPRVTFQHGIWEGLGGESFIGQVEPFLLTLEPGADSGENEIIHTGHEFVICLEGVLAISVDDKQYLLNPGDSLLYAAHLKHHWRNPGDSKTIAVFVVSGFDAYERPSVLHFARKEL